MTGRVWNLIRRLARRRPRRLESGRTVVSLHVDRTTTHSDSLSPLGELEATVERRGSDVADAYSGDVPIGRATVETLLEEGEPSPTGRRPCPVCGGPAHRAMLAGIPGRICDDEDCGCAWGPLAWAMDWTARAAGAVGEPLEGWPLVVYERPRDYWRAVIGLILGRR